jgi:hypothetical protein
MPTHNPTTLTIAIHFTAVSNPIPFPQFNNTMGLYDGQEEHDNLVWDKNDEDFEAAQRQLRLKTFCRRVEAFVQNKFDKPARFDSQTYPDVFCHRKTRHT